MSWRANYQPDILPFGGAVDVLSLALSTRCLNVEGNASMSTVDKWLFLLSLTNTFAIIVIVIAMRQAGVRLRELVGKLAATRK